MKSLISMRALPLGVVLAVAGVTAGCNQSSADATRFAQVLDVKPVTQTTSHPHQECRNVQVTHTQEPADKHEILGTAVGALVGGAAGHQVGGGNGKKLATVAGAVAGGYAGKKIQERTQHPNTTVNTERRCSTVVDQSSKVVGYDVTYQYNGSTHHTRMDHDPGDKIQVKDGVVVVGGSDDQG